MLSGAPEDFPSGPADLPSQETGRLVRAARDGDVSGFAGLYERIAPSLHTWAELRIRPALRARLEPSDVVQEVWCRAWRKMPSFDPEATPFRPWIFRIAKNVLLEAFRLMERQSGGPATPGPTTRLFLLENLPDDATAISRRMARDENLAAFGEMLRSLDEDEQKLVLHCGLEGMTHEEVAGRMNLSADAVAKRWQRLRASLFVRGLPVGLFLVV
jgi:RNA polymerase sigma-70 factor (ECF subfamily)